MSCIFCKIVEGEISAKKVYEDEDVLVFHDINPVAPVHVLIIPKKHLAKIADITINDAELMGKLMLTARKVAEQLGVAESGFRLVINNGESANQTVFHLHIHLIGGRAMTWPPG
jgi:histidine triad (HIT) family protein